MGSRGANAYAPPHDVEGGDSDCAEATNPKGAVLGPNADLDANVIDEQVCACDEPGPHWRGLSLCSV